MDNETTIESNEENLELYSNEYPFKLSLRIKNFNDDAEYKKFIKSVERLIRSSTEYKEWKGYIIDALGIDSCMITNETMDEVTVEVHHHIPSLYDIVCAVVNEHIDKDKEFCSFDISTKIIELHFQNKIGYVTLIKSMHEKFHNGYLRIPINIVKGDYKYILKKYMKYFDDETVDRLNFKLAINKSNCEWTKNNYEVEDKKADNVKIDAVSDKPITDNLTDLISAT